MFNISFNFDLFNNYYYFYERLVVLAFSLIPTLILVGFVLYSDRRNKEPVRNIVICLLSGILSVALSGYLEQLVMPYIGNNIILTYIFAFIEEISKNDISFPSLSKPTDSFILMFFWFFLSLLKYINISFSIHLAA